MNAPTLLPLHQPGDSPLHRLPVGAKVGGLVVFSLAVVLTSGALAAGAGVLVAAGLAALAGLRPGLVLRTLRPVLLTVVVVGLLQWLFEGPAAAAETALELLALALAASVVTATTAVNDMLDALVRWLGPFRRVGVRPDRVALAFTLALQSLPGTLALALETRDAARARGLGRHPRAYLTPFVVRVVARAHEQGDALAARGLGDESP